MPSNTTSPKGKRTGSKEETATNGAEEETSSPEETCKIDVIAGKLASVGKVAAIAGAEHECATHLLCVSFVRPLAIAEAFGDSSCGRRCDLRPEYRASIGTGTHRLALIWKQGRWAAFE